MHTASEQKYHESGRNIEQKLFECRVSTEHVKYKIL